MITDQTELTDQLTSVLPRLRLICDQQSGFQQVSAPLFVCLSLYIPGRLLQIISCPPFFHSRVRIWGDGAESTALYQ